MVRALLATMLVLACEDGAGRALDAGPPATPSDGAATLGDAIAPPDARYVDALPQVPCLRGAGTHRVYLQGRGGDPDAIGRYALLEDRDSIVHGEHFMLSKGAFVEWAAPLCADIGGQVHFYVPNNEDARKIAAARLELVLLRGGVETPIAEATDTQYGQMGYVPFEAEIDGVDPAAREGDLLIFRATTLTDAWYAVVIFNPPSEYMAWVELIVH
ncbi:MAG: hypothetical protein AABZ30_05705 [Myxococcota bacterium]